jgi:phosphoribosylformylglycinamidine cyclo-ligase
MEDPLLVASTDGVGTKLLLALEHKRLDGVGQDLVAMCVNDLIVCGARPLFFLDYIATAKLQPDEIETIVGSVNRACVESDCLLIGGECAEMPGMYAPGHTDLAGFAVGVVDRPKLIDGTEVKAGDVVLGLASSGLHSNGFSLVRKLIVEKGWQCDMTLPGCDEVFLDSVLEPTKLYVKTLMHLIGEIGTGADGIKACAHITGGGIIENIPRVIPDNLGVVIQKGSWHEHAIFGLIREGSQLSDEELYRTFNCGIGLAIVVGKEIADHAESLLYEYGEKVSRIGEIIAKPKTHPALIIT